MIKSARPSGAVPLAPVAERTRSGSGVVWMQVLQEYFVAVHVN